MRPLLAMTPEALDEGRDGRDALRGRRQHAHSPGRFWTQKSEPTLHGKTLHRKGTHDGE